MSYFLTEMSDALVEKCQLTLLHDNRNLSHHMVHDLQVAECRLRRKKREAKRVKSYNGGSSKGSLEIQGTPRFNKRFFPKVHDYRVSNPKYQKGKGTSSPSKKPTFGNFGKKNYGESLVRMDNWFGFGMSGHKVRDCSNIMGQEKSSGTHKQVVLMLMLQERIGFMHFAQGVNQSCPYVVTNMLQVFSINLMI